MGAFDRGTMVNEIGSEASARKSKGWILLVAIHLQSPWNLQCTHLLCWREYKKLAVCSSALPGIYFHHLTYWEGNILFSLCEWNFIDPIWWMLVWPTKKNDGSQYIIYTNGLTDQIMRCVEIEIWKRGQCSLSFGLFWVYIPSFLFVNFIDFCS